MIKYILRKKLEREGDIKNPERLLKLTLCEYIIQFTVQALGRVIPLTLPIIIVIIIATRKPTDVTKIAILMFAYVIGVILIFKFFNKNLSNYLEKISSKFYFNVLTRRGRAINREDFRKIKDENKVLFEHISRQDCWYYCYFVSFEILRILQKGHIVFTAIKRSKDNKYTIHVFYENNGWVFNVTNARQYPIDEIYKIYDALEYRRYSTDEIESVFEKFRDRIKKEVEVWCKANDCDGFSHEDRN